MRTEKKGCIDKLNKELASQGMKMEFFYDDYWGDFLMETREPHYPCVIYPMIKAKLIEANSPEHIVPNHIREGMNIPSQYFTRLSHSQLNGVMDFRFDTATTLHIPVKEDLFRTYTSLIEEGRLSELQRRGYYLMKAEYKVSSTFGQYFSDDRLSIGGSHGRPLIRTFDLRTKCNISFKQGHIVIKNNRDLSYSTDNEEQEIRIECLISRKFGAVKWTEESDNFISCSDWVRFGLREAGSWTERHENVILEIPEETGIISILKELHFRYGMNDILGREFLQYLNKLRGTNFTIKPSHYIPQEKETHIDKSTPSRGGLEPVREKLRKLRDLLDD